MTRRPNCPCCGRPAIITDDRFGGRYECPDCDMWAWGGKPLRTRAENNERRKRYRRGSPRVVTELAWNDDAPPWVDVLGCPYPATMRQVTQAFRKAALRCHPDRGGDAEAMAAVVAARDAARVEIEGLFVTEPRTIEL